MRNLRNWGVLLLCACTSVVLTGACTATAQTAIPVGPIPPYHVRGNEVLGKNNLQFVPRGFVIDCAAFDQPVASLCTGKSRQNPWPVDRMLTAAAGFWYANVVRVQVAPELLMPGQDTINTTYLKLIQSIVNKATSLHMVTILSDQTERFHGPALPVASDIAFWQYMAAQFKSNPRVMFDLYNEPRLRPTTTTPALTENRMWQLWQDGGTYNGTKYVGDNAIIAAIRSTGANNVLVAESNQLDTDLSELPTHLLTDPERKTVYGVEPNLTPSDDTLAEWKTHFGDLAGTYPIFPEAFLPHFEECNQAAPTILPKELNYLGRIGMGVIVWTLRPGETTQGDDLEKPTSFNPTLAGTDPCLTKHTPVTKKTLYGEGADILRFFTVAATTRVDHGGGSTGFGRASWLRTSGVMHRHGAGELA